MGLWIIVSFVQVVLLQNLTSLYFQNFFTTKTVRPFTVSLFDRDFAHRS